MGLLPRRAAWEVLQAVSAGAFSDSALERIFRTYSLSNVDKALVTEIAYGSIRQSYYLDCWIDCLGKISAKKQPPLLRLLLHIGLYQIIKMEKIPPSAAINTSVELAKKSKIKKLSPVVNGLLRSAHRLYKEGKGPVTSNVPAERIAQEYSLPLWLVEEIVGWKGEKDAELVARAWNQVQSLDLRVNSWKTDVKTVKSELADKGIQSVFIENCPSGLSVSSGRGSLSTWPGYKEGEWCVQNRSSQLISPLLNPQKGDRILDACAAPGGKTTHLAELMEDRGELWAVDSSQKRLKKVFLNASRLGLTCIRTLHADASCLLNLRPEWKCYFQKILLDAPCSGLGTLARNPDARWRITPQKIKELIILQEKLVESLLPLLAPGGRFVYSTCTINHKENASLIDRIVLRHSNFTVNYKKQIWPDLHGLRDGFFMSIIDSIE